MSARASIVCRWCFQEGLCLRALCCGDVFLHVAGFLHIAAFLHVATLYEALCVRDSGSCILSESKKALHDRPCGGIAVVSFWILEHQCIGAEKLLQMGFPLHRLNIGNNTERDARLAIVWCILLPEFAIIVFGDDISGVAFAGGQLHAPAGNCRGHCSVNDRILARCFSMHSCQPWDHYTVAGCGPSNTSDVAALHMRSFERCNMRQLALPSTGPDY